MKRNYLAALFFASLIVAGCQPNSEAQNATAANATENESSETPNTDGGSVGSVFVSGSTQLEPIRTDWGGVAIEARLSFPIDYPETRLASGLFFTVIGQRSTDVASVFVPEEELEGLLEAIERIRATSENLTSLENMVVQYVTPSGLGVKKEELRLLGRAFTLYTARGSSRVEGSITSGYVDAVISQIEEGRDMLL